MSDIIRKYPFMTPDTVRQKTRIDQAFFEQHTPKEKGYDHINGTKYAGTAHNYGSEMLLETRKVRQRRPPIGDRVSLAPNLQTTFDLTYADEPSTYEQECPFAVSIRPGALGSNIRHFLVLEECEPMYIPRPISDEDDAYSIRNLVWKTNEVPKIYHEDDPGSGTFTYHSEIEVFSVDETVDKPVIPTYWFHNTSSVNSPELDDVTPEEREIMLNRMMISSIEPYENEHGETKYRITSVDLEPWIEGVPIVWITLSNFKELPTFEMTNNVDQNGFPLFVPGIDGSGEYYLYPFIYSGKESIPPASDDRESNWAIRILSSKSSSFIPTSPPDPRYSEYNVTVPLSKIQFVRYDSSIVVEPVKSNMSVRDAFYTENVYEVIDLTWNDSSMNLTICPGNVITSPYGDHRFTFTESKTQDFDYDGMLYENKIIFGFNWKYDRIYQDTEIEKIKAYPMFKIHPKKYEIKDWNWLAKNAVSGVHVDYTTDYSENGVIKTNGTIFNYGCTDGLPPYYYYKMPRTIHRAHTELYLGHDSVSDPNNNVENEQFVTLLVDAAVPQIEIESDIDSLPSGIIYRFDRLYYTDFEYVFSPNNVISDIGYVSRTIFGDVTIPEYKKQQRFIYHGHRKFSLNLMGLDPLLEYGRVYTTSNEDSQYKNNETLGMPRPARTMARICDIPTDTSQLTSIKNVYPTILIDPKYVRTELSFSKDDRDRVLQIVNPGIFIRGYKDRYRYAKRLIYNTRADLVEYADEEYLTSKFPYYKCLDSTITIDPYIRTNGEEVKYGTRYTWDAVDSDEGFKVGDVLKGYIGGKLIRGIVSQVSGTGQIRNFDIYKPGTNPPELFDDVDRDAEPIEIPIANLQSRVTYTDLKLERNVDQFSFGITAYVSLSINATDYASIDPYIDGPVDNIHGLYKDILGNLYIARWDLEESQWMYDYQITGPTMTYNIYDDTETRAVRTNKDFYMFRTMSNRVIVNAYNYSIAEPVGYTFPDVAYFNTTLAEVEGESYDDIVKDTINDEHLLYNWAYYSTYDANTAPDGSPTPTTYISMHDLYYNILDQSSERSIYPSFNAYQGMPDTHLCSGLIFDNMVSGYNTEESGSYIIPVKQPNVFIYNPFSTIKNRYYSSSSDIVNYGPDQYIGYADLDNALIYDNHSVVQLACDVWKNTTYELETNGESSRCYHPNTVDNGETDTLPLRKIGSKGDIVGKYVGGKFVPEGEQPTGAMRPASARLYPISYSWDNVRAITTDMVYFFKIDDPLLASLDGFRMKDQYTNTDISYKTIILFKGKLYVYKNNQWIKIARYN